MKLKIILYCVAVTILMGNAYVNASEKPGWRGWLLGKVAAVPNISTDPIEKISPAHPQESTPFSNSKPEGSFTETCRQEEANRKQQQAKEQQEKQQMLELINKWAQSHILDCKGEKCTLENFQIPGSQPASTDRQ